MEFPDVPERPWSHGHFPLRYADIAQDGRLLVTTMAPAIDVVWHDQLTHEPTLNAAMKEGVIPILTRLVVRGTEATSPVRPALEAQGCFWLARGTSRSRERPMLDIYARIEGTTGLTYGTLEGTGRHAMFGEIYAAHVFTRPFAAVGERRIERLEDAGFSSEGAPLQTWSAPRALLEHPPGCEPMDPEPVLDPVPIAFSLCHTDSNQHVNSLVYPRLFEDAALRALARHPIDTTMLLARALDVRFRKPCFAGDRVRIALQVFRGTSGWCVIGGFFAADDPASLHHTLRMDFT